MSALAAAAVFAGAGCGALLRWAFGLWLNPVFPTVPLGTLAANLVGGLLVGLASGFFAGHDGRQKMPVVRTPRKNTPS